MNVVVPVQALSELHKEALVVLVGDAHEPLQQRAPLAGAQAEHVHVDEPLMPRPRVVSCWEREDDGTAYAVACRQFF